MKIYIAGPYSADTEEGKLINVNKAIDAAVEVFKLGHYPFIPHLTHYVDARTEFELSYEDYLRWDFKWLDECEAILVLAESPGTLREVARAKHIGLMVYNSISEIREGRTNDRKWTRSH